MGARVSAKGVTKFGFGKTDPTKRTSANTEAANTMSGIDGIKAPPPARDYPAVPRHKAKGATRTKGGAI